MQTRFSHPTISIFSNFTTYIISFLLLGFIGCGGDKSSPSVKQNREIDMVKNGMLALDKTVTVGNALDGYKYFNKKEWKFTEDPQKRKTVEFLGTIDLAAVYGKLEPKLKESMLASVNESMYFIKFNLAADDKTFSLASGGEKIFFKNGKIHETTKDPERLLALGEIQNIFRNNLIDFDCVDPYLVQKYIAFPLTQEEREKLTKQYSELDSIVNAMWTKIISRQNIESNRVDWEKQRDTWIKERDAKCNAESGESTKLNCLISMTEQQRRNLFITASD